MKLIKFRSGKYAGKYAIVRKPLFGKLEARERGCDTWWSEDDSSFRGCLYDSKEEATKNFNWLVNGLEWEELAASNIFGRIMNKLNIKVSLSILKKSQPKKPKSSWNTFMRATKDAVLLLT